VLDDSEQPFTSFDSFWGRILTMPYQPPFPLPAPGAMPPLPLRLHSLPLERVTFFMTPEQEAGSEQLKFKWRPGIEGAILKLDDFIATKMQHFEHDRWGAGAQQRGAA
jgi:deoxyribodipyrimidine photolyase